MPRKRTITAAGFTLLEVLLVVVIVAVFAAMAMPRLGRSDERFRVELAARKLLSDIEYVRAAARARGPGARIEFAADGARYQLLGTGEATVVEVRLDRAPFRTRLTTELSRPDAAPTNVLEFDRFGTPGASGVLRLRIGGPGGAEQTVTITLPGGAATIP